MTIIILKGTERISTAVLLLSQICLIQIARMLFAWLGIFFLFVSGIVYEVGRGSAEAIRLISADLLMPERTLTQC